METKPDRILSLDVFRGLTIAGMIVVNDPGSWSTIYPPLRHAPWHGLTPTDLVFPFFLFIVGVTTVLSLSRRKSEGKGITQLGGKILWRTAIIFGLGLLLWLFPYFDFSGLRWPGVLQRIAIVYGCCAVIYLVSSWRFQLGLSAILLIGYCAVMQLVPVPIDDTIAEALRTSEVETSHGTTPVQGLVDNGNGTIAANLEPGTNLEAWIDRKLIPGRLWEKTWDPEGLLSTLPAVASGLVGMLVAQLFLTVAMPERRALALMLCGFSMFVGGCVWDWFFPFNKNLWTSSFVLVTSGLAASMLGLLYWLVDIAKYQKWTYPFQVFGANAIAAYVLHGVFARLIGIPEGDWAIQPAIMTSLTSAGLSGEAASLTYALAYTLFIFVFVWIMYRNKVFLKV